MASRRAAVTCPSRSSMACRRAAADSLFPVSDSSGLAAFFLSGLAAVSSATDFSSTALTAHARTGEAIASASAIMAPKRPLFVILVLIRPVLALERPVLLVIAHQPLELKL